CDRESHMPRQTSLPAQISLLPVKPLVVFMESPCWNRANKDWALPSSPHLKNLLLQASFQLATPI
ncbi:mCG146309, partial [Mus musculus]